MVPVVFTWQTVELIDGDGIATRAMAMVPLPRYGKVAARQFHDGEDYPLVVLEARSRASHSQYFAALGDAFDSLPENLAPLATSLALKTLPPEGFVDAEHLRKWALCETNWCDVTEFDFDSIKDARTVARLYRAKDRYAQILVRGAHVTIKEAKSQSAAAMAKGPFEESKRAVLDLVASMVGVKTSELKKHAGRSA